MNLLKSDFRFDPGWRERSVFTGISLKSKRSRWRPRTTMAPCLQRQKTSTVQTPTTTSTTRPASRGSPRHLTRSTAEILTHPSALLHQTHKTDSCNFSFWEQPFIYCFDVPVSVVCSGLTSLVLKGSSVFEKVAHQLAEDKRGHCRLHIIFGLYIKH